MVVAVDGELLSGVEPDAAELGMGSGGGEAHADARQAKTRTAAVDQRFTTVR